MLQTPLVTKQLESQNRRTHLFFSDFHTNLTIRQTGNNRILITRTGNTLSGKFSLTNYSRTLDFFHITFGICYSPVSTLQLTDILRKGIFGHFNSRSQRTYLIHCFQEMLQCPWDHQADWVTTRATQISWQDTSPCMAFTLF